jgi:WNK lysine deficient protein kinase
MGAPKLKVIKKWC